MLCFPSLTFHMRRERGKVLRLLMKRGKLRISDPGPSFADRPGLALMGADSLEADNDFDPHPDAAEYTSLVQCHLRSPSACAFVWQECRIVIVCPCRFVDALLLAQYPWFHDHDTIIHLL